MARLQLEVAVDTLRLAERFRISGHVFETADVLTVTLHDASIAGWGGGRRLLSRRRPNPHAGADRRCPRRRRGGAGPGRDALREILSPGGARNAIDAALLDLEAKRSGQPAWRLAGVPELRPIRTAFTVSADAPEAMAGKARRYADALSIKMKLTGELDLDVERVRAVRAARPDVWLGVDGNQGFAIGNLPRLVEALVAADVSLLEQPLARGRKADLEGFRSPVPIAGDKSLLSLADVSAAPGRFDLVNIKLDKCGGLTEGLLIAAEARRLGLGVMVSTMVGTSLATAPGFILGQVADLVDLDRPTFLAADREPSVTYEHGKLWAGPEVWGAPD